MTNQQLFDIAFKGLSAQGRRSVNSYAISGSYCLYRSPDNLKCAVGFLIPDNRYDPIFDQGTQTSVLNNQLLRALLKELYGPDLDLNFLAALQDVHDSAEDDTLVEDLITFAQSQNLEVPTHA